MTPSATLMRVPAHVQDIIGTKIVAQSPPGCIVPATSSGTGAAGGTSSSSTSIRTPKPCLFDFDVLQEYIIPRNSFFNRYIAVNDPDSKYSVLGFPVSIANPKYQRNEFIFNFGLVVESDVDQIPYERVVRRLAVTFAEMEKQNEYLSRDGGEGLVAGGNGVGDEGGCCGWTGGEGIGDSATPVSEKEVELGGRRPIESLLEIIKEDLNNYGECMIPVGKCLCFVLFSFLFLPSVQRSERTALYCCPYLTCCSALTKVHNRRRKHNQHEALSTPSLPTRGKRLARPCRQDEIRRHRRPNMGPDAAKGHHAHRRRQRRPPHRFCCRRLAGPDQARPAAFALLRHHLIVGHVLLFFLLCPTPRHT